MDTKQQPKQEAHVELYRRFRPLSLEYMVGNEETVNALRGMLENGSLPHAILFAGPAGTGKTTMARIIQTEMECGSMDYNEMNSASYRGIDSIRDIQNRMWNKPVTSKCRIWVFDEAHKLSNDAQNAMLKMLEDPPAHAYFILCTTEPYKLIAAIHTRCHPLPTRALLDSEMDGLLTTACRKAKLEVSKEVREALITGAQGSARMLWVLLEKVGCLKPEDQERAIAARLAEESAAYDLCRALIDRKPWEAVVKVLAAMKDDPETVRRSVLGYSRSVLLNPKTSKDARYRAYLTIDILERNLYDGGAAGLAARCFEICTNKDT